MKVLIENVNKKKYIYEQIYDNLKVKIKCNEIGAHEQLPSKRKLANKLQVSVNSVMTAYEQLLADGYIYAIERIGYFVADENIDL